MAKAKKKELTLEEKLEEALVPKNEQPYKVPANWIWCCLENIVSIRTGKKDANYGTIDGKYFFFTCAAEPIRCDNYSFEGESILLAGNGANVGLSLYYDGKFEAYQRTYVLQSIGKTTTKFIFYNLVFYWKYYNEDKQFGSATNYIKLGNIQNFPIPLPPLAEQQRIVNRIENLFSKLDRAKELLEATIDSFESRKAAILHKAFTGELTEKWREENRVSFDSWASSTLGNVVENFKYGTSDKSDYLHKGTPILRIPNIGDNGILSDDMKFSEETTDNLNHSLKKGDILIIRSNGSRDLVGKCSIVDERFSSYSFASYLIRLRPRDSISPLFLEAFLKSPLARGQMFDSSKSSAGINNINTKELASIKLQLPRLTEQQEIVRILESFFEKENKAKELYDAVGQIELLKKSILARAFRGELGTNNSEEESAIELLKEVL